jgi:hypothetical protein
MADGSVLRQLRTDRLERAFLLIAREADVAMWRCGDVAMWQRCQAVMRCSRAAL